MTRFVDEYLSRRVVGYPVEVGPLFSTQLVAVDSGAEQANRRWADPIRQISIPNGVRDHPTFEDIKSHWLVMGGPAHTWPWRDPTDFASVELEQINEVPTVALDDQVLGTGDGLTTTFQLKKRYTVGASTYDRDIHFPITSSVLIGIAPPSSPLSITPIGSFSPTTTFTVSRPGGVVTFSSAIPSGYTLTAGFLFDIQVRYESDDTFRGIMRTFGVSGFADVPLMEVRYCED